MLLVSLPLLYPHPWKSGFGKLSKLDLIQTELQGRWRGTTSTNDFVPSTVDMLPGPTQSVIDSYATPPIDRVNRFTLPEGTTVDVLNDQTNHFRIQTEQEFLLRLYLFYFPGWRAYVDGNETEIQIAHPEGFISIPIPQGTHEVSILFGDSISRSISWWISGLGLLLGVGGLCFLRTPAPTDKPHSENYNTVQNDHVGVVILGLVVIFFLVNFFILNPRQVMVFYSDEDKAQPAERPLHANFGEQIVLLGYDFTGLTTKPGGTSAIQLYWNAEIPITDTFQSFVHVMTPSGQILAQSDHLNPGGFPTNLWPLDRYVRDKHSIILPDSAAPGRYTINVGLYSLKTGLRLYTAVPESGEITSYVTLTDTVVIK